MNVAIVGNGPSADGRGDAIDACDFVVRIKGFWNHGASQAGSKLDAWATFGEERVLPPIRKPREIWYTRCTSHVMDDEKLKLAFSSIVSSAHGIPFFLFSDHEWQHCRNVLGAGPSTGFVAVCMAISRFPCCNLHLFGFDSTTPVAPNWEDATPVHGGNISSHPFVREKQEIAKIDRGEWFGANTDVTLTWANRPQFPQ